MHSGFLMDEVSLCLANLCQIEIFAPYPQFTGMSTAIAEGWLTEAQGGAL